MKLIPFIQDNLKWIAIVALAIICLLMLKQCRSNEDMKSEIERLEAKNKILDGNLTVMKDTVKFWKDSDGNHMSSIGILTADKEMLNGQFKDLNAKYKKVSGKSAEDAKMIAYLNGQISFKDREISDLRAAGATQGSRIINDSTILVDIGKQYDSTNSYTVNGNVYTSIKDNKITAGKIDLTTSVNMGLEIAINRDNETKIARITTKTAFPAKIVMRGITEIENELNKKPKAYLGLGLFAGYGLAVQKQPIISPMVGVSVYYSPSWLTIKLYK